MSGQSWHESSRPDAHDGQTCWTVSQHATDSAAIRVDNGHDGADPAKFARKGATEMSMPMDEPTLPADLVEARHTPLFDAQSLPPGLAVSHRTTVWATLHVQTGTVRYIDLEGPFPRDVRLVAGDSSVIVPGVEHYVEPSTDAKFFIQFYREART